MVYVTVRQSPQYRQMTLEELLFQNIQSPILVRVNTANTRTYEYDAISPHFTKELDIAGMVFKLHQFNQATASLRQQDRQSLYHSFEVPKKSGGFRRIDNPSPELKNALRTLKTIFEEDCGVLYHTTAFAYVKKRCTIDALKRHQSNESRWFAKLDIHDFFGSTTLEFAMSMFSMVFPFSEIVKVMGGRQELQTALELAFLNGGLPQGSPVSPLITNIIMIPVDYKLSNALRHFRGQSYVYTRYADDFTISSKYDFDIHAIEALVTDTLQLFHAPFSLNAKKTRYGSSAGRNWNLGLMLNKDNQITIGAKKKRQFQSMLYNYITAKQNNKPWTKQDIQVVKGYYSYYHKVEGETIDAIIRHINTKMGVDVLRMMDEDLACFTA